MVGSEPCKSKNCQYWSEHESGIAELKYLLLIPSLIFFGLFTAWPLFEVVRLSLYKTNFITTQFVGLQNYISSFQDPVFIQSLINSAFYMALLVPGQLLSAMFFALWLYRLSKRWQDVSRVVLYLPTLSAGIIIAQSWRWLFHINGPINWLLGQQINWFGQFWTAIPIISFIVIFSSFGANTIIILAALQGVGKEYIEAAWIDGCTYGQIKRKILIPLVVPTLMMVGILSAINALMIFENIYALSPYGYSATMTFNIFQQGFKFSKYGMASAQAIILLGITAVLSLIKKRIERW